MNLRKLLCGLACVALAAMPAARAQHVPETTPRAGEQRLNRFQYRSSHNSYEQTLDVLHVGDLSAQLDKLGFTQLELDLAWDASGAGQLWVQHLCSDQNGAGPLEPYLNQIRDSRAFQSSLIFLAIDEHRTIDDSLDGSCVWTFQPSIQDLDLHPGWKAAFETMAVAKFGDAIYTHNDFVNIDQRKWPSMQELLRRGKHIVITLSFYYHASGRFFSHYSDSNKVVENTDDETKTFTLGDRYLSRSFPSQAVCGLGDGGYETARDNGFTFPAVNCLFTDIVSETFHPPVPTYVTLTENPEENYGTWGYPYKAGAGVRAALERAQGHANKKGTSIIPVVLKQAGTYSGVGSRLSGPVRLSSPNGLAKLTP